MEIYKNMLSRKIHRYIGLSMLLPMIGWALTGLVFFIKPGYEGAYEMLTLKTYPLESGFSVPAGENWQEARLVRSTLGHHLLVRSNDQFSNVSPSSFQPMQIPAENDLKRLFEDALSRNPERYGSIATIVNVTAHTTTGIDVTLDWNTLKFTQIGFDRTVISALYKIHYLQWTPWALFNQILGIVGLAMLVILTLFGVRLYVANRG